ncbi:MAG TPA: 5-formyltetrahydrofolate cyclo-ligase [Armatimonadota bacterium]|nr:5-formyltetrahydrofolate cyclo-ligase [Armatimonadota bacterium]
MSETLRTAKAEVRAALRAQRDRLAAEAAAAASAAIARHASHLPPVTAAGTCCCYLAVGREVATRALISQALLAGKRVVLPRTAPRERRLALHAVDDLQGLVPGPYGILEPPAALPEVDPAEVDVFLAPGLAFDTRGGRLGYGGGYYDRMLADAPGWRIALTYAQQLVPRVPMGATDIPMDLLVTEGGVIDCALARRAPDWLRLRDMTFYGHHGAHEHERLTGIRLAIDADLRLDVQAPGLTDDLTTTVDYPAIYGLIAAIQGGQSFHLLESLAARIADAVLAEFPAIAEIRVRVRKFHPPVGGPLDAFEVELARERPDWTRPRRE